MLCTRFVSVPPATVTSAAVKPVGASEKVKVTSETLSPLLSSVSTISTVTLGATVSTATVSLPPVPGLAEASV